MEEKIVLTLDGEESVKAQSEAAPQPTLTTAVNVEQEEVKLSPEEQQMVDEFSEKIDLENTDIILNYGSSAQKKIAEFSDHTLDGIKAKDLGEIGDMITELVTELKSFDIDEDDDRKGLFSGLFKAAKKVGNNFTELKAKYDGVEANVDQVAQILEDHQITLLKDITMLDELYNQNETNKKELTMYIMAGKKKLKQAQEVDYPALLQKAKETNSAEDAQIANDYAQKINRFEKKIHDLEMTRMIAIQMGPQIRLIQNNDILMAEKIQATLNNTIPLW